MVRAAACVLLCVLKALTYTGATPLMATGSRPTRAAAAPISLAAM